MASMFTKRQLESRVMLREKRFRELLVTLQPSMPEPPGTIKDGILTVPVNEIELYIKKSNAAVSQATIRAFLATAFDES